METDTIIIEDAISALRSCDKVRIIAVGGGQRHRCRNQVPYCVPVRPARLTGLQTKSFEK